MISVSSTSPVRMVEDISSDESIPNEFTIVWKSALLYCLPSLVPLYTLSDIHDWARCGMPIILLPILLPLFSLIVVRFAHHKAQSRYR